MITLTNYEEILRKILNKVEGDEGFRARALEDAPAAIREVTGQELPPGVTVKFVEAGEASSDGRNFVIPLPAKAVSEISERELDAVAGGGRGIFTPEYWQP